MSPVRLLREEFGHWTSFHNFFVSRLTKARTSFSILLTMTKNANQSQPYMEVLSSNRTPSAIASLSDSFCNSRVFNGRQIHPSPGVSLSNLKTILQEALDFIDSEFDDDWERGNAIASPSSTAQ